MSNTTRFAYGFDEYDSSLPLNERFDKLTFKNENGVSFEVGRLNEGKLVRFRNGAYLSRKITNSRFRISLAIRTSDVSKNGVFIKMIGNSHTFFEAGVEDGQFYYQYNHYPNTSGAKNLIRKAFSNEFIYMEIGTQVLSSGSTRVPYTSFSINGVIYYNSTYVAIGGQGYDIETMIGDISNSLIIDIDDMYCDDDNSIYNGDGLFVSAKVRDIPIVKSSGYTSVTGSSDASSALSDSSDNSFVNITETEALFETGEMKNTLHTIVTYRARTTQQGILNIQGAYTNSNNSEHHLFADKYMPSQAFESISQSSHLDIKKIKFRVW